MHSLRVEKELIQYLSDLLKHFSFELCIHLLELLFITQVLSNFFKCVQSWINGDVQVRVMHWKQIKDKIPNRHDLKGNFVLHNFGVQKNKCAYNNTIIPLQILAEDASYLLSIAVFIQKLP